MSQEYKDKCDFGLTSRKLCSYEEKKKDMKPINMINIMGLRIECTETEREQKYICQFFFQGIKVKLDLSPKAKR